MCLILVAYGVDAMYPFVVAANRDEFYERATAPADFWSPETEAAAEELVILAGRDLQAGGTWLGITTKTPFRFAAVTNYREVPSQLQDSSKRKSRGGLVTEFFATDVTAELYLQGIQTSCYEGFNLLVADDTGLWYCSNRGEQGVQRLEPGRVYGLCNRLMDDPWPKVEKSKQQVSAIMETTHQKQINEEIIIERIMNILRDTTKAPVEQLPSTGVTLELEELFSSIFIESDWYGTRATTVLLGRKDNNDPNCLHLSFVERSYGLNGKYVGDVEEHFQVNVCSSFFGN